MHKFTPAPHVPLLQAQAPPAVDLQTTPGAVLEVKRAGQALGQCQGLKSAGLLRVAIITDAAIRVKGLPGF